MPNVEITTPCPNRGVGATQILVNGIDLSEAVSHYRVDQSGPGPATVTLTIEAVRDYRLCSSDAFVHLDASTKEFLVEAGWTPPAADGGRN